LESAYEEALCVELQSAGIRYTRQLPVSLNYKGHAIGEYRIDLLIEDTVIVELKSVERFDPVFEAQILTYLRLSKKPIGLILNFNSRVLKDGTKRFVLSEYL
jgi:GxxExxY protein